MKLSLPFKISLFYAGCGGLWMLLADRTLAALSSPGAAALQKYQGCGFVLLTTLALWAFARRQVARRQRGEAAHRETERQLAAFAGAASDGFLLLDENLTILFANPAAEKMNRMGRPLVGMQLADLSPGAVSQGRIEQYRQTLRSGNPVNFEDVSVELPSGSHHLAINAFKTSEGIGLILRDISEQVKTERMLRNYEKMVMGILSHTSLLLATEEMADGTAVHLKAIEECTCSASHLTTQLLGFARGGKYEVKTTDLAQLIQTESALFARTRREIRVEAVCSPDLRPVEADRNQIAQVLLNLFVNAWQAMPKGGSLHVNADNVVVDAQRARACGVAPGPYVRVAVRDTGVGMDAETRQRIFEPFFTTRRRDRGTGLGLAAVYGIVRNHMGFITVSSLPDKGTTFEILLPASDPAPTPPEAAPCQDAKIAKGRGNVLLVDDEEMILTVGKAMLEKLGYSVQTALSGREALALYDRQKEALDLVILDMIMPDTGGDETFDRLRAIDPAVRVLLSSGFSLEGKASQIMARGCNGFIQKPFSLNALSRKVREVMTV